MKDKYIIRRYADDTFEVAEKVRERTDVGVFGRKKERHRFVPRGTFPSWREARTRVTELAKRGERRVMQTETYNEDGIPTGDQS